MKNITKFRLRKRSQSEFELPDEQYTSMSELLVAIIGKNVHSKVLRAVLAATIFITTFYFDLHEESSK